MQSNKKPVNATELMMQALRHWEQGTRSRGISRRVLSSFLEWAVIQGKITNNFADKVYKKAHPRAKLS